MPFDTPSRKSGVSEEKELLFRQLAANFIEFLGKNLTSYLIINTATVYMHRFYMYHSFTVFPWKTITAAALFLAAKVEEHPCRLKVLIAKLNDCLQGKQPEDSTPEIEECLMMENLLLQTLGFDLQVLQPHTIIIRCYEKIKIPKHISKAAYYFATYVLQLTVMCIEHSPSIIACFCLHLTSKWSGYIIPKTTDGQEWYYVVDKSLTTLLLDNLTMDFEEKMTKCPPKLKESISKIYNGCRRSIDAKENLNYVFSTQKGSNQVTSSNTSNENPATLKGSNQLTLNEIPASIKGSNQPTSTNTLNEAPTTLKRTLSFGSKIEQLDDNVATQSDTYPTEPLPKIYRSAHPKDPRTTRPDFSGATRSGSPQLMQIDSQKMVYPSDSQKAAPKDLQNAIPRDTQKATPRELSSQVHLIDRPAEES